MNNKETPEKCGATLCCKATAELQIQIENEKNTQDKCLAELLDNAEAKKCGQENNENKNSEE